MTSALTFRLLAIANLALGALLTLSTLFAIIAAMRSPADVGLVTFFFVAFLALIAVSLAQAGWNHLRKPSRKTALVVAANTSVVIFGIVASAVRSLRLDRSTEPAVGVGAILVAYLVYRWFLRPLAVRSFDSEAKNA
jgi:branched-subunit amino acid ABC-type transport system permease component